MLSLRFGNKKELKALFLGAHCDDIEIGCGGTILRLSEEYTWQEVKWVVFTSTPDRAKEAKDSAAYFLEKIERREVIVLDFKDGYLPQASGKVKDYFEALKRYQPDVIFTHYSHDMHQDHRLLSTLTWNTFRDHLILEYEIPKYDGDLANPNFFVPLQPDVVENKVAAVIKYFPSQHDKQWFDKEAFRSVLRLRGLQSASTTKYAEGFYLNKSIF